MDNKTKDLVSEGNLLGVTPRFLEQLFSNLQQSLIFFNGS